MHNVSSVTYNNKGAILAMALCSAVHVLGPRPRDSLGRPLSGDFEGQWEPGSPDAPSNPESRTAKMIAAIEAVDRSQAVNLTTNGKPKVEAIEKVFGAQISYHERDLVWRYLNPPESATTAPAVVAAQAADIDARQSLIQGAIRKLDRDNKDLWMPKNGKPKIEAIEALIAGDVSASERDAAWHIISQE